MKLGTGTSREDVSFYGPFPFFSATIEVSGQLDRIGIDIIFISGTPVGLVTSSFKEWKKTRNVHASVITQNIRSSTFPEKELATKTMSLLNVDFYV